MMSTVRLGEMVVQTGLVAVLLALGWMALRVGRTWLATNRFDRWRIR